MSTQTRDGTYGRGLRAIGTSVSALPGATAGAARTIHACSGDPPGYSGVMATRTPIRSSGGPVRGISTLGWALRGAAAGAAGTTALNTVTYLDMAVRGRPASSTPERTVEQLAGIAHVRIPGEGKARETRLQALGALTGLVAGIGFGTLVGLVRAAGLRTSPVVGTALTTAGVLVATNGPMTALGITDPRTWSATDWISDLVPHLAYGVVVGTTMEAFEPA